MKLPLFILPIVLLLGLIPLPLLAQGSEVLEDSDQSEAASRGQLLTDRAENIRKLIKQPKNPADAEKQADAILALLTAEERFQLACGGNGLRSIGDLPKVRFGDASAGLRIDPKKPSAAIPQTTAFPCTQLLTAAWNPELAFAYGQAVAEEFRAAGRHVLLGPGVNIYRLATNGRNFEYMGEDPYLAGRTAAAYIRGAQEVGVMTTVKHFLSNNTEFKRRGMNAVIDERTLHEIYLPAFQASIDAGAWAVMTSYNQVNGQWVAESKTLVTDLLRNQMGFDWLVMTDWTATWHGDKALSSGIDLEMPGGSALKEVQEKAVGTPEAERMARSILKTFIASGVYEKEAAGEYTKPELAKFNEHTALARKVNEQSIVLLKNNGILPLKNIPTGSVLVTGNFCEREELAGKGSGHVVGYDLITYAQEAMNRFGKECVIVERKPTDEQIKAASLVLLFSGFPNEGEGENRRWTLPDDELITRAVKLNPNTVVGLVCGGGTASEWANDAAGILFLSYGGQTAAPATFDIFLGKVNPSGKLPFSFEKSFSDSPGAGNDRIPPNEWTYSSPLFEVKKNSFFFDEETKEVRTYDVRYDEGIFVGYRGYDDRNVDVRFPFGHGLSYTKFAYSNLKVASRDGKVSLEFTIENIGDREGGEVVQVYVSDKQCRVPRPPKELKNYQKVFLAPGEKKMLKLELGEEAFRFWDPAAKKWMVEPGKFEISVGSSSRDIRLKKETSL